MCAPVVYGLMIVSALMQAKQQRQNAQLATDAANLNAKIARQRAADARARGDVAELNVRRRTGLLIGRQKALIASSGAEVGVGSASLIVADAEAMGELDAINARNNAMREAYGFEAQASQFSFQSDAARAAGKTAVTASLLSSATSIASFGAGSGSFSPSLISSGGRNFTEGGANFTEG